MTTKIECKDHELEAIFSLILDFSDSIRKCGITNFEGMKKLYERNMEFQMFCERLRVKKSQ